MTEQEKIDMLNAARLIIGYCRSFCGCKECPISIKRKYAACPFTISPEEWEIPDE